MRFYFAPLEGVAGYLYRNAHRAYFKGIDRYYSPFVVTRDGGIMKNKELRDILPENNKGLELVPQILTNLPENFIRASAQMRELGYTEVNLNLGCPSGTVVSKGRGAGFLARKEELARFLDEIFKRSVVDISIKTRLGFSDPEEFYQLLEIYNQYPVKELIIHPRTRQDFYKNSPNRKIFADAYKQSVNPVCYNGDITTVEDYNKLTDEFPSLQSVMIGRGLLSNPGLVVMIGKGSFDKETFILFYQKIYSDYRRELSGEVPVLYKMKELWIYMASLFTESEKYLKKIKKVKNLREYEMIVSGLFREQDLTV